MISSVFEDECRREQIKLTSMRMSSVCFAACEDVKMVFADILQRSAPLEVYISEGYWIGKVSNLKKYEWVSFYQKYLKNMPTSKPLVLALEFCSNSKNV